jgi:hypothetical protein
MAMVRSNFELTDSSSGTLLGKVSADAVDFVLGSYAKFVECSTPIGRNIASFQNSLATGGLPAKHFVDIAELYYTRYEPQYNVGIDFYAIMQELNEAMQRSHAHALCEDEDTFAQALLLFHPHAIITESAGTGRGPHLLVHGILRTGF